MLSFRGFRVWFEKFKESKPFTHLGKYKNIIFLIWDFVFRFSSPKVKEKSYSLKFFTILLSTKSNAQFEHIKSYSGEEINIHYNAFKKEHSKFWKYFWFLAINFSKYTRKYLLTYLVVELHLTYKVKCV